MARSLEVQPFSQATPERMKYWGGFFDETLYFDIQHTTTHKHPKSNDPTLEDNIIYNAQVVVNSSDKPFLESLLPIVPGKIYPNNSEIRGIHFDAWELRLREQIPTFRFITRLKPYLEYTQPQAEIIEEFLRQKREVRRELEGLKRVPYIYPTPADRIAVEEALRERLLLAKAQVFNRSHLPEPERLAGIIDADASFGIYSTERQNKPSGFVEFQACGELSTVNIGLLHSLHELYGGTKPTKQGERTKRYAKPSWLWRISGQNLVLLLEIVEPHLIFKQTQARLMLDFLRLEPALKRNSPDSLVNAQRTFVLQTYVDRSKELNHPNL